MGILQGMIFFRKKKPAPPAKPVKPAKKSEPPAAPEPKTVKSLQEIAHTRVLTAEGWRRSMEKKIKK
jgi:hypothetical protein